MPCPLKTCFCVAFLGLLQDPLGAQVVSAVDTSPSGWRFAPVDTSKQVDSAPKELRRLRNLLTDEHYVPDRLGPNDLGPGPGGDELVADPEMPPGGGHSVWLIGAFTSYSVFQSTKGGIYTEIHIQPKVIIHRQGIPMSDLGNTIDLAELGGTILDGSGRVLTKNIKHSPYSIQPGHIYLCFLTYDDTYKEFSQNKVWDVTTGTLMPITHQEILRAQTNRSILSGKPVNDAVDLLTKRFAAK